MTNEQYFKKLIAEIAANIKEEEEIEIGDPRIKKPVKKGISKINFKGIKEDPQISKDAMAVVSKISRDAEDFPKKATIGKMFVNNDAKQGEMVVFRIDFESTPSFVATIKTNPSDLLPQPYPSYNIDKIALDTYAVTVKEKGKEAEDKEMVMTQMKDLVMNFKFKKDIKQPLAAGDGTLTLKSTEPIKKTKEKEKKEKTKFLKKDLAYSRQGTLPKSSNSGEKAYSVTIKVGDSESKDMVMTLPQIKKLVPDFKIVKDLKQSFAKLEPQKKGSSSLMGFTKKGVISLNSTTPVTEPEREPNAVTSYKDDKVTPTKTFTKVAKSSQSPAIVRSVKEEEEQSFGAIKKRKSAPVVSAGLLGQHDSNNPIFDKGIRVFSKFQKIDTIDWLQSSTKDLISRFLRRLGMDYLKETDMENSKNMKKDFKQKISEIASKIAGLEEMVDDKATEKINLTPNYKSQANSAISTPPDLAKLLLDIIKELLAGEASMQDIEKRAGWSLIMDRLKSLSGDKKGKEGEEDVPEVPDADKKEMPLQEAFNRINRK